MIVSRAAASALSIRAPANPLCDLLSDDILLLQGVTCWQSFTGHTAHTKGATKDVTANGPHRCIFALKKANVLAVTTTFVLHNGVIGLHVPRHSNTMFPRRSEGTLPHEWGGLRGALNVARQQGQLGVKPFKSKPKHIPHSEWRIEFLVRNPECIMHVKHVGS